MVMLFHNLFVPVSVCFLGGEGGALIDLRGRVACIICILFHSFYYNDQVKFVE